jgi:hypothetical protein
LESDGINRIDATIKPKIGALAPVYNKATNETKKTINPRSEIFDEYLANITGKQRAAKN